MRAILLNDNRNYDTHLGCVIVGNTIDWLCQRYGIELVRRVGNRQVAFDNQAHLHQLNSCDAVIINGEGTLHHDASFAISLMKDAQLAKHLGKRVYLINCVWQENYFLDRFIPLFDQIYTRESYSAHAIRTAYPNAPVAVVPDLTFYSAPITTALAGVQPLPPSIGGDVVLVDSVLPPVNQALLKLSIRTRRPLLFMEKGSRAWTKKQWPKDALRSRWLVPQSFGLVQSLQHLERYHSVVTGRFHCITLCVRLNKPLLFIPSNTWKSEALFHDMGFGDDDFALNPGLLDRHTVERRLDALQSMPSHYFVEKYQQYMAHAQTAIEAMFESLVMPQRTLIAV